MKVFFNHLYDYNYYCNKQIIDLCTTTKEVPEKALSLFSHILNAHAIWNARILDKPHDVSVWQMHDVTAWEDLHYQNQRTTFGILTNNENFDTQIDYQNSNGKAYSNSLQDILFHIINHSTHHRAQINAELKANKIDPLVSDYIFYKR
jgi:uncharacterized damage-inducible protein DinB